MAIYHRVLIADPAEIDNVQSSGEIWGRCPRNTMQNPFPKVQAFHGQLPSGDFGYEFTTDIPHDKDGHPIIASWTQGRPGVENVDSETVKVRVRILKIHRS